MHKIECKDDYLNMTGVAAANFFAGSGDTVTLPVNPSSIDERPTQEMDYTVKETLDPSFVRVRIREEDEIKSFYLLMKAIPTYCLPDGTYLIPSAFLQELDKLNILYEPC
ncbi:MAG: hypothetical protein JSV30_03020 [Candidatus Omnitrophota bacterium]|nr:MAG: hypothetical protein JSV30_03020 [Candidatus Omnitrophota bacterium]